MSEIKKYKVTEDLWSDLKSFTDARIALGKTGISVPLKAALDFKLAHAEARDAVFSELDENDLREKLSVLQIPIISLHSQANDRHTYLQRPDLGRILDENSREILKELAPAANDICICIADGLSAQAIQVNVLPLLNQLIPSLQKLGYTFSPITIVQQGRVAIADEVGATLRSKMSIILIGERPGLSAADSLGVYLTYQPKPGKTDESRNCISNVRPAGLSYERAVSKIHFLVTEAFRLKLSGIQLKDLDDGSKKLEVRS